MSEIRTLPGFDVRNVNEVRVAWLGDHRFEAGRPGNPALRIDADSKVEPGPVDTLLSALGSCTAVDVVDILAKRRTPVATLTVEVQGARAKATPARVIGVLLTYRITGGSVERVHAERAIELAVTKYCSVRDTLDRNMPVDWVLELNGELGEVQREKGGVSDSQGVVRDSPA